VDQLLLLPKEYLVAENRILKTQLQRRLRLSDPERSRGEIGHRLGREALSEVERRPYRTPSGMGPKNRRV
jgi:hypothetical protein